MITKKYIRALYIAALIMATPFLVIKMTSPSYACCVGCLDNDCPKAEPLVDDAHQDYSQDIREDISKQFSDHKDWITDDFLKNQVAQQLQIIARQLTKIGTEQIFRIGTFFDSAHQLQTQRLFNELTFEAHKRYQPSESFCTFGTAVRSLAHTETAAKSAAMAISRRQMSRHLGTKGASGGADKEEDKRNRWAHFIEKYCDPQDNNWVLGKADSGLTSVCGATGGGNTDRINIDIDYTRAIENKRTLNLYGGSWVGEDDELDIIALGNNLYGHDTLSRNINESDIASDELASKYLDLRSVAAKRGVAENSFNAIVGLKSQGATGLGVNNSDTNKYLGKILQDLGIPEDDVVKYLGLDSSTSPYIDSEDADASYLATMEILAKKIYQNPTFYANLYDTPANIKRKSAALKAFELMLDRSIFESQLRQEMAMSVLLSSRLERFKEEANQDIGTGSDIIPW